MLELKKGIDILSEIGGIKTIDQAKSLFNDKLDPDSIEKLGKIKTEEALLKIANAISNHQFYLLENHIQCCTRLTLPRQTNHFGQPEYMHL